MQRSGRTSKPACRPIRRAIGRDRRAAAAPADRRRRCGDLRRCTTPRSNGVRGTACGRSSGTGRGRRACRSPHRRRRARGSGLRPCAGRRGRGRAAGGRRRAQSSRPPAPEVRPWDYDTPHACLAEAPGPRRRADDTTAIRGDDGRSGRRGAGPRPGTGARGRRDLRSRDRHRRALRRRELERPGADLCCLQAVRRHGNPHESGECQPRRGVARSRAVGSRASIGGPIGC